MDPFVSRERITAYAAYAVANVTSFCSENGQTEQGDTKGLTQDQVQKQRDGMAKVCASLYIALP